MLLQQVKRLRQARTRVTRLDGLEYAPIFVDLVLLPNLDLYFWRLLAAALAMLLLVYGLVWEGER